MLQVKAFNLQVQHCIHFATGLILKPKYDSYTGLADAALQQTQLCPLTLRIQILLKSAFHVEVLNHF